jgi:hypothetical protein
MPIGPISPIGPMREIALPRQMQGHLPNLARFWLRFPSGLEPEAKIARLQLNRFRLPPITLNKLCGTPNQRTPRMILSSLTGVTNLTDRLFEVSPRCHYCLNQQGNGS